MHKNRLEAFSDGVIAIIITIMVLELKVPKGDNIISLQPLLPVFLSYILSFLLIGIYWNNHHHMLHAAKYVNGKILWANMHLLFWLSLIPFATAWMGENHFASFPVAVYGFVQLMAAISYFILSKALIKHHGDTSMLATSIGSDMKGKLSLVIYIVATFTAFLNEWIALGLYVTVVIIWFIPDRRIEQVITKDL